MAVCSPCHLCGLLSSLLNPSVYPLARDWNYARVQKRRHSQHCRRRTRREWQDHTGRRPRICVRIIEASRVSKRWNRANRLHQGRNGARFFYLSLVRPCRVDGFKNQSARHARILRLPGRRDCRTHSCRRRARCSQRDRRRRSRHNANVQRSNGTTRSDSLRCVDDRQGTRVVRFRVRADQVKAHKSRDSCRSSNW